MARYDYRCGSCGKVFEVEHGMTEHPDIVCPECGGATERVFNASGIKFEGSGFYNTDQRGGSSSTSATSVHQARRIPAPAPIVPITTKRPSLCS